MDKYLLAVGLVTIAFTFVIISPYSKIGAQITSPDRHRYGSIIIIIGVAIAIMGLVL